tara:strand:+ start:305 stop:511 length:207 start_codon:yes stop_codon:yes gene_type:complete
MKATEIKKAIEQGNKVFWKNTAYEVIKDSIGQYLIKCHLNNYCIGLTHKDNKTLNGDEKDFFIQTINN